MPDGSIIFEAKLDNSELAKELSKTKSKIIKEYDNIQAATARKNLAVEQIKQMEAEMLKLQSMAQFDGVRFNNSPENVARIGELQSKLADLRPTVEQYEKKIQDSNIDLDLAKEKAGLLEIELAKSANDADRLDKNTKKSSKAMQEMEKRTRRFGSRMREIVTGALFFNIISRGISGMVQWTGNMIKANDDARASIASLKGALLTLAQPILNVVIPAFVSLVNILTRVIAAIASVVSRLFGTTAQKSAEAAKSLNKQAGGYGGVAKKAKEATKSLMAFDELNTLQAEQDEDSGGGGGAGGTEAIAPDFGLDFSQTEEDLKKILHWCGLIGSALLGWKIGKLLNFDLPQTLGLIVGIAGAFIYLYGIYDALVNGLDWENLSFMITGMSLAVLGMYIAFGTVGAAITLLITGIGLLIVGIQDWIREGELSNEASVAISIGLLAIGTAISLLTGSWIPILIAAVLGMVILLFGYGDEIKQKLQEVDDYLQNIFAKNWEEVFGPTLGSIINGFLATMEYAWNGIKLILDGLIDFITGVFTGNWELALNGIYEIVEGFGALIASVIAGIGNIFIGLINTIIDGINWVFGLMRGITFNVPVEWGGGSFQMPSKDIPHIPYLAQGAVIPPNREFLAVLGDQSHGTNIEAPLETIKQAVAEVMGSDIELMREQNDILRQILAKTGNGITLRDLTNQITTEQRSMSRARGVMV